MRRGLNRFFHVVLVASRWAMAPLSLGLLVALVVLLVQFFRDLAEAVTKLAELHDGDVILAVLKLVDLVLVGNLLLMIVEASVALFAPPAVDPDAAAEPEAGTEAFAVLKPKLFAAISTIAAIDLLETFINIDSSDKSSALWQVVILLTLVVAGLVLAGMGAGPGAFFGSRAAGDKRDEGRH